MNGLRWKCIFLVIAIILLVIGFFVTISGAGANMKYRKNTIECDAVITRVNTEVDNGGEFTEYDHTYYGDYVVDGKEYTNIELDKTHGGSSEPEYSEGETIKIKVWKDSPEKIAGNGTIYYIVGFVLLGSGVFWLFVRSKVVITPSEK